MLGIREKCFTLFSFQYLEENVHKTYVDVSDMARVLQERYRAEYGRRKIAPFRQLVEQAYKTVLHSYGLDSNPSSDENEESDLEFMDVSFIIYLVSFQCFVTEMFVLFAIDIRISISFITPVIFIFKKKERSGNQVVSNMLTDMYLKAGPKKVSNEVAINISSDESDDDADMTQKTSECSEKGTIFTFCFSFLFSTIFFF